MIVIYCGDCGGTTELSVSGSYRVCHACGTRAPQASAKCTGPAIQNAPYRSAVKTVEYAFYPYRKEPILSAEYQGALREAELRAFAQATAVVGVQGACVTCGDAYHECEC